jgi:hypothetical protein
MILFIFLLTLILTFSFILFYNLEVIKQYKKDLWLQSEEIICFFIVHSLIILSLALQICKKNLTQKGFIAFLLLIYQVLYFYFLINRKFDNSILISYLNIISSGFLLLYLKDESYLFYTCLPYLFCSIIQLFMLNNIKRNNLSI